MLTESDHPKFTARVANLAAMRTSEAKDICRRRIETVASITDQLNHTPEEAAVFKPWCAAMREHYQGLKAQLAAIGDEWNTVETPNQDAYDVKDIGYNEAISAIDVLNGWPAFPGWDAPASPAPVEEHKFPAPDERLSDWDFVGVSDTERGVLKTAMEEGESVSAAKRRLYPILNEELSRLQNQEALLGASTPESVSARRKEVESLLGILARVGDA